LAQYTEYTSVSIHAPARGATIEDNERHIARLVSIHAPARGATETEKIVRPACQRFNPRTREGCDTY